MSLFTGDWHDKGGGRIMNMGNVNDFKNFKELWHGEKYATLRKSFIYGERNKYTETCNNCPLCYEVLIKNNLFENPSNLFNFLPEYPPMLQHIQLEITTNCVYGCETYHRQIDPNRTKFRVNTP